jgi:NAD(P)-dependent dehydrogenase (short-subunit alcohol dehydrogenase family)
MAADHARSVATDLAGRTAIVSGSGRGIGREVALKLAAHGASVVVNDLDAGPAEETAAAIRDAGGRAIPCVGSVTEDGFAEQFVATATETFGGLDIIVNNAGYTWDGVIQKMTDEQFDAIVDVHLKAPFRILRAAQPVISAAVKAERAAGGQRITRKVVNISSVAGTAGNERVMTRIKLNALTSRYEMAPEKCAGTCPPASPGAPDESRLRYQDAAAVGRASAAACPTSSLRASVTTALKLRWSARVVQRL